jgi:hypothetical protein
MIKVPIKKFSLFLFMEGVLGFWGFGVLGRNGMDA